MFDMQQFHITYHLLTWMYYDSMLLSSFVCTEIHKAPYSAYIDIQIRSCLKYSFDTPMCPMKNVSWNFNKNIKVNINGP